MFSEGPLPFPHESHVAPYVLSAAVICFQTTASEETVKHTAMGAL